jgi:hypothetical protein
MNVLGHQYFARSLRETSQIKFKDNMAPTVAKFGSTFKTGADGTAGSRKDGSLAAAKHQKTAGSTTLCVFANFNGFTRRLNPPRGEAWSKNPPTAAAASSEKVLEVIPSDKEPHLSDREEGLMGAAAQVKAFAHDDLVFKVIEQNFPLARAFGAKAADEGLSGLGAVMPAAAAAA